MSSLPLRSPLFRRTLLSATLCPLLVTSTVICFVGGYFLWTLLPFIAAFILSIRLPYRPAVAPAPPAEEPGSPELRRLNSRISYWTRFICFVVLINLTEGKALFERLTDGSLLRWETLALIAAFTLVDIYRNHRALRELSNEQFEAYQRGDGPIRLEGGIFRKIPAPTRKPVPAP